MKLENKVAIITGGASGLGESTVRLFVQMKAKVDLNYIQVVIADMSEENGNRLQKELGDNTMFVKTNVADEESIKNMVK